jgi:UDP-galactopyranose mutase
VKPVVVIGAGWSGTVVARALTDAGLPVEVLERAPVVGGHSRVETLCGVMYEPNGPHLLHTNSQTVTDYLLAVGLTSRPYRFQPLTEIETEDGPRLMSWPPQIDELESLPDWPQIKAELEELPPEPSGADFESYAVSLMGRRLYELFIEGYTRKQWGCEPNRLSSSFAPKRIDLRRDGCRDLFRDRWQWFPPNGVNDAIDWLLRTSAVTTGAEVTAADLAGMDAAAVVVTAALDDFVGTPDALPWRGVHLRSTYYPAVPTGTGTPAYVINRPSMAVPYTRTIETKHASGQRIAGTVVSEEYPGADAKHYPVADLYGKNARVNDYLQADVRTKLAPVPVFFCGRLATYRYINQDEAILDALACAEYVMAEL